MPVKFKYKNKNKNKNKKIPKASKYYQAKQKKKVACPHDIHKIQPVLQTKSKELVTGQSGTTEYTRQEKQKQKSAE